jgi:hypothetical protein
VANDIPLGCPLFLPVNTVNCVQTLKANCAACCIANHELFHPLLNELKANCAACCTEGNVGDFDASFNGGVTWVNGTRPVIGGGGTVLQFQVVGGTAGARGAAVTHARCSFLCRISESMVGQGGAQETN